MRAIDHLLHESFDHAIWLRSVRRAGEMQHQLVRRSNLQLDDIIATEEVEQIFSIELPQRHDRASAAFDRCILISILITECILYYRIEQ